MKTIGKTFGDEIQAAGLGGLPFSWGSDGQLNFSDAMTPAQIVAVQAIYEAHDPVVSNSLETARILADETAIIIAKADTVIQNLVAIKTLTQCNTFCSSNFPTLTAPEKAIFAKIIFALSILAKERLR